MKLRYRITLILLLCPILLLAQAIQQRVPDPNTGDEDYLRTGIMDGNRIRTMFKNWGEIAEHPNSPSCEWPKGTGHEYQDGVSLIVSVATDDATGKRIHPMETQYREFVDFGSDNKQRWGWAPLPGYFSEGSISPAMSDDSTTWPNSWPDKPSDWDGYWNGWFGKGKIQAELETYFVFDDDQDEEWNFYPNPSDTSRRGVGLEVAARYFQWGQVLARDALFALYFVTNEGKTDYDSAYFSFYTDWGMGDLPGEDMDNMDDAGSYDLILDIAYAWDSDWTGYRGWSVGVGGFAFLESPGITYDGRDNDVDGIVDESRINDAGEWLDVWPYKVQDPDAFFEHFGREPKPHWEGDEDGDWRPFLDVNNNGKWDHGEPLNDDVGEDGLGPYDEGYAGPDNGEGDNRPTIGPGNLPGEPNFGKTDKDESDQIGLTGFEIFNVHDYELTNDEQDWNVFRKSRSPEEEPPPPLIGGNLGMFFSSGPFKLKAGQTENYSMALLFADDLETLARRKKTVQSIYDNDYRFAVAPDKPRLTAAAGDGKVVLKWDNTAEYSWDPFLQQYDFEGYQIFRATESEFQEALKITNAYGDEFYYLPYEQNGILAQFDKIDGKKGLHPVASEGIQFNLGNDTGLRHVYIDTSVVNGQTYFYAVVSYDHGTIDTTVGGLEGITPMWCTSRIEKDISGKITPDINCAVVTPNAYAAGYLSPGLDQDKYHNENGIFKAGPATGSLTVDFIDDDSVKNDGVYEFVFRDTSRLNCEGKVYFSLCDSSLKQGWAVGSNGTILQSIDGGQTWITQSGATTNDLLATHFIDKQTGWIVGKDSTMLQTTNGGKKWNQQNTGIPGNIDLFAVHFNQEDMIWAAGAGGTLFKSVDGVNWTALNSGTTNNLYDVFFRFNDIGWIAGAAGTILKTKDGGATWLAQNSRTTGDLSAVYFHDTKLGWVVGADGVILRTKNGGTAWSKLNSGTASHLKSVHFANANIGYAVGANGTILKTTNGGTEWVPQSSGTANDLHAVHFMNTNWGWAVGAAGLILRTTDGGENWENPDSGTTNDLYAVYVTNRVLPEQALPGHIETPIIDGMVLNLANDSAIVIDYNKTGWINGDVNYKTIIDFHPNFSSELQPQYNVSIAYPADFQITFSDHIIDSSDAGLGFYKVTPTKFSVWNVTENAPAHYFFNNDSILIVDSTFANDGSLLQIDSTYIVDSTLTSNTKEAILIYVPNDEVKYLKLNATWRISFDSLDVEASRPPQDGDVLYIATKKSFSERDTLRFTVNGIRYSKKEAKSDLDDIYVVPNPYVAVTSWEPKNPFIKGRGERRLWFVNVPKKCTIRIYTVRGYLVDTIEYNGEYYSSPEYSTKELASGTPVGAVPWDLVSKDNMDIAYGIYIYHVDAPGVGEKIGKFAVIK